MQVLAREEPKRGIRDFTEKKVEWQRDVDEARTWLRERGIEPKGAVDLWWKR